jgi:hypothetical protein
MSMLDEALYAPFTPTEPPSIGIIPISLSNESVVSLLLAVRSVHEHSANKNVFLPRSPVHPARSPGNSMPPIPSQKSTAPVVAVVSPAVDSPTVDSPTVDSPAVDSPGPVVGADVVDVTPSVLTDPVLASPLVGVTCVVVPSTIVGGNVTGSVVDPPDDSSPEPPHATNAATTHPPQRICIRPTVPAPATRRNGVPVGAAPPRQQKAKAATRGCGGRLSERNGRDSNPR